MALSDKLISDFAKMNKQIKDKNGETTVTGTAKLYDGKIYVQLDGSDQLTPIASSTAGMKDGDRVTVLIKNHTLTITGNTSDPSASSGDLDDTKTEIGNKITEFEIAIGDKVDVTELNAVNGRIDNLVSENVTIKGNLDAANAKIDNLEADNATINGKLDATEADIDNLEASKADISVLEANYATIENLEATNANIHNLEADYGEFKDLTTEKLTAHDATIDNLDTNYAKIDFANIGTAAVENLFAKSGIIEDLIVSEGHITGELVGVTIKGDLIEGGTVVADKLVVKGSDGLYYKLNTDGVTTEAEQTEYNSLNGSVITAKSITATKIAVDDLVAFDATIGGFVIDEDSIHTNTKASVDSPARGVYLDNDGQVAFGDSTNYLKYYKDTDGTYKLDISAGSLRMASTGQTVEEAISKVVKSMVEEFYQSDSATELSGGSWSTTQPTWASGKYIWRRTLVTYADNTTSYTPSETGVCITGNTGPKGDDGVGVTITSTTTEYQVSANGTTPPTGSWLEAIPTVPAGQFLWTRVVVEYSNGVTVTSYSVSYQGQDGGSGEDGKGISTVAVAYQSSVNGTTAPSGTWHSTIPTVDPGEYLWTRTITTYTDGTSTTAYSVGKMGSDGQDGTDGVGIESTTIAYQAGSSQTVTPTGDWTEDIPTLSSDLPYLWTRTVVTYTDDTTSTSYSVSSTFDSIKVGGTNLLLNSKDEQTALDDSDYKEYLKTTFDLAPIFDEELGDYVLSFELYSETAGNIQVASENDVGVGGKYSIGITDIDATTQYIRYEIKINPTLSDSSKTESYLVFYGVDDTGHIPHIRRVKLERGNTATDWSPSPEETQNSIDNVGGLITNVQDQLGDISQTITTHTTQINSLQTVANGWELNFNTIEETITELGDTVNTNYAEQLKYIKFIDGEIWLGKDPDEGEDDFKVVISNERIRFLQNNTEVAYLSNNQLYITNTQILKRLDLGNFAFFPRENGNLTFRLA